LSTLKGKVARQQNPDGVNAVYELVIDGLDEVAMHGEWQLGIWAASKVPGVKLISARQLWRHTRAIQI